MRVFAPMRDDLKQALIEEARTLGFDCVGVTDPAATTSKARRNKTRDRFSIFELFNFAHQSL